MSAKFSYILLFFVIKNKLTSPFLSTICIIGLLIFFLTSNSSSKDTTSYTSYPLTSGIELTFTDSHWLDLKIIENDSRYGGRYKLSINEKGYMSEFFEY